MIELPGIRLATEEDVEHLADIAARAMVDYPWTTWTVPADRRLARLTEIQHLYLAQMALPYGMVWTTVDRSALAAFVPSDAPAPPLEAQRRLATLHHTGLANVTEAEERLSVARPEHEWVLACAAVDPQRQGTGLGSAVVSAGLAQLDADRATCLTETTTDSNVRFYARLGWTPAASIATGGPTVHVLIRQPA